MKMVDFIVCDDIRQEVLNKVTLVGIYTDKIILPPNTKYPAKLRLSFFSKFLHEKSDPRLDSFRVVFYNNDKEIARVDGMVGGAINLESPFVVNFVILEFPVLSPGEIKANFVFLNKGEVVNEIKPPSSIAVLEMEPQKNQPGPAVN